MNRRRQRFLLVGFAVAFLLYCGDYVFRTWYDKPLEQFELRRVAAGTQLLDLKKTILQAERKLDTLDKLRERSLPSDPEIAVARYRTWLLGLIETCGIDGRSVDYSPPVDVTKLYRRHSFAIRGTASLDQMTNFLYEFYSAGHLHSIRSLNLTPVGSERFSFDLGIDAIAILSADGRKELSTKRVLRLNSPQLSSYRTIAKRNIFASAGSSFLDVMRLSAVTTNARGAREAWISDESKNVSVILTEGEAWTRSGYVLKLLSATDSDASMEIDGDEFMIQLGQKLSAGRQFSNNPLVKNQ